LVVFILYLGKMYKPMQEISKMTDTYSKAAVGYERMQEILQTHVDVKDARRARRAPRLKGNIEFKDVSFSYDHETPVLKNVSLQIKAGQVSALVGPTGAGKSSIIGLIPRFYDPNSGVITVDGIDVKTLQQKSLRNQMSFVLQETVLFHASVWQNIAYGKPNCTRGEIIKAAELANAMEFIEKLPNGLDTILGERGMTLSGGQRQRIAIARAVIRNTPILILDEPTSGLDSASEQLVFEAMDRLMSGKTVVVIAHRLSTIQKADVIFVIKDGEIVERGNHEDLMKLNGLYAELHNLQFREEPELTRAS
jgi:subfamily B ATP-binding cassette protein MsbA